MATASAGPKPRFTYGDYRHWADGERWELIGGEPRNMSPAPRRAHQEVLGELFLQVATALRGQACRAYIAPFDVRLPARSEQADDDILDVVQPDLSVICDRSKLDDCGCRGAPDWIVEVLSPRTSVTDQITKRDLYARSGVREYWIIDPTDALLTIYRDPSDGRYTQHQASRAEGRNEVTAVAGLFVDWGPVFERR